ncbi:MAG: hypothetical protein Q7T08_11350, partial [Devosia sp.]|nr:hypothetical protein [Devosia sp.]
MAERSTGPVKPPVIDLTARSAKPEIDPRPEPKPPAAGDAAPSSKRRNDAPPRLKLDDANWPLLGGAAIGGAVLGTLLTYLVASALPLPTRQQAMPPDLTMEVTAQGAQLDSLEASVGDLQRSTAKTQVSLDATIAQLDAGLTEVRTAIADVEAAVPPPVPVDLAPIEAELRTLKAQIDAIAAGASGAEAGAIAQSLSTLETGLTSLTTRIDGVDAAVVALRTGLDAARKTLTDHIAAALPNEAGPALKLPLILSGLESAFASGKPFATELTSLSGVLP